MVTADGRAKVLDFGIAQGRPRLRAVFRDRHPVEIAGAIVGSAPYMSPEQARGDEVDQRTESLFSRRDDVRNVDGRRRSKDALLPT
jgi:serine/threonine-protein kinase